MNKEYEITTLQDIKDKIPSEKQDAFLADLKIWLQMDDANDALKKLISSVAAEGFGLTEDDFKCTHDSGLMTWIDDGETGNVEFGIKSVIKESK